MKVRLCYKIDKSVGLAEDKHGNPGNAYSMVRVDTESYQLPKDKYNALVSVYRKLISEQLETSISNVTPITLNEYLDMTEEKANE